MLNVIDHLPNHSAYGEALALDRDLVDPDADTKKAHSRPSIRDWGPIYELLVAIHDQLNGVIQVQADKDLHLKPWLGPLTAAELIRQEKRQKYRGRLERLVDEAKQRAKQAEQN